MNEPELEYIYENKFRRIMKISYALLVFSLCLFAIDAEAQTKPVKLKKIETAEFSVQGVCGMCQERIEKAALIKGVKLVEWDKDTQKVKVIYATKKVEIDDVHKAIAGVGHDTELVKAEDEAYAKLPDCCAYRDGVEVH
jgi:copper chaperone CopZ